MRHLKSPATSAVCSAILLLVGGLAHADGISIDLGTDAIESRLDAISRELKTQRALLDRLESVQRQQKEQQDLMESRERQISTQRSAIDGLQEKASAATLASQRGAGQPQEAQSTAQAQTPEIKPVGQAPAAADRPPEVAPLFEQPGVLTPAGQYVLEPSMQYGYSSSNRVAMVGYTIIPALLIGLLDVREVKRNTVTAALSARFGISRRLELEVRAPYVYRSDATVSRDIAKPSSLDSVFPASGKAVGDIEFGARYQLNDGGVDKPFFIGTLRVKTRTGKDPFEVVTDCQQVCVGNTTGTGLPLDLPTGSGFYSLQTGLTALYPSDPGVFFGSITYLHNFKRDNVSRLVLSGQEEFLGTISPAGVFGFNFGMGLALNEKSSFSIGYDHNSVGRTRLNGTVIPGSVRTQLGTLVFGYAHRLNNKTALNVSVGAGITRDTPDVSLSLRLPTSF